MAQGGISLLSTTAADAEDPQTLRMVAGAIANLCGNGILFSLPSSFLSSHLMFLVIHVIELCEIVVVWCQMNRETFENF